MVINFIFAHSYNLVPIAIKNMYSKSLHLCYEYKFYPSADLPDPRLEVRDQSAQIPFMLQ
jgi:hypothetical protein